MAESIDIELNGQRLALRCTSRAAFALSDQFGGLVTLMRRVAALDLNALTAVIREGTNSAESSGPFSLAMSQLESKEQRKFAESVFYESDKLVKPALDYIELLSRGGKPAPAE
jgi:hypothetical protein